MSTSKGDTCESGRGRFPEGAGAAGLDVPPVLRGARLQMHRGGAMATRHPRSFKIQRRQLRACVPGSVVGVGHHFRAEILEIDFRDKLTGQHCFE